MSQAKWRFHARYEHMAYRARRKRWDEGGKEKSQMSRKCMTLYDVTPTYLPSMNVIYTSDEFCAQHVNVGRAVGKIVTHQVHSSRPLPTSTIQIFIAARTSELKPKDISTKLNCYHWFKSLRSADIHHCV
jgi:hypothetical protein